MSVEDILKKISPKDGQGKKNLSWIYVADASKCLEKNAICSKEHDTTTILQKNEPVLAETVLMKTTIPEASANNTSSDSEEFLYESDEDIPYFSDVESVVRYYFLVYELVHHHRYFVDLSWFLSSSYRSLIWI